jgi:tRNA dimethylallyltransferase
MKNKLLVICGPTATGKSILAVELAKVFNGEIISADSRQVYRGLDIGSAKIAADEMQSIPHYLIDVADPTEVFTVAEFKKLADEKISEIIARGKLPILCGGTGMYISAVIDNQIFPEVPPDEKLRSELEKFSPKELFEKLKTLDPIRAQTIDSKNPIRLIRAIEVVEALGSVPELNQKESPYETLSIGLDVSKGELTERIKQRIEDRIPALFDEIRNLHDQGVSFERLHAFGLEYRYGAEYIQNKITLEQFKELLATKTWQYVKRQMTWFKANPEIHWINPITDKQKILKLVQDFLS